MRSGLSLVLMVSENSEGSRQDMPLTHIPGADRAKFRLSIIHHRQKSMMGKRTPQHAFVPGYPSNPWETPARVYIRSATGSLPSYGQRWSPRTSPQRKPWLLPVGPASCGVLTSPQFYTKLYDRDLGRGNVRAQWLQPH